MPEDGEGRRHRGCSEHALRLGWGAWRKTERETTERQGRAQPPTAPRGRSTAALRISPALLAMVLRDEPSPSSRR
jgi:hypothetical protein